jgi:hypothetical protein
MEGLDFVFNRANLGPTDIIMEDKPHTWDHRFPSGIDLSPSVTDDPFCWRVEVQKALEAHRFDDV